MEGNLELSKAQGIWLSNLLLMEVSLIFSRLKDWFINEKLDRVGLTTSQITLLVIFAQASVEWRLIYIL